MDLARLFDRYGSDKDSTHFLADFYTRLTSEWRDRPGALAEIGLRIHRTPNWQGGSGGLRIGTMAECMLRSN